MKKGEGVLGERRRPGDSVKKTEKSCDSDHLCSDGLDVQIHPLLNNHILGSGIRIPHTSTYSGKYYGKNIPKPDFATVKANRSSVLERKTTGNLMETKDNPYFSSSDKKILKNSPNSKFRFVNKGKYVSIATKLRKEKQLERLKSTISQRSLINYDELKITSSLFSLKNKEVPKVEWWDEQYLKNGSYEDINMGGISYEVISVFVYHPMLVVGIYDELENISSRPLMLTSKERAKLRRQKRLEEQKSKRETVQLGLSQLKNNRLKFSNLASVFSNEAFTNPTEVGIHVQRSISNRLKEHLEKNESNKLDKTERMKKIRARLKKDLSFGLITMVVFYVKDLTHPKLKFKIRLNAKQNLLFGVCFVQKERSLVIVEGGQRSVERYKKLMLNRIDWNDQLYINKPMEGGQNLTGNYVSILWNGHFPDLHFSSFELIDSVDSSVRDNMGNGNLSSSFIMDYLKKYDLEYIWELVLSHK